MEAADRVVDLLFGANARAREIARRLGVRSDEYAAALDEVRALRAIHDEERLIRKPPAPPIRPGTVGRGAGWRTATAETLEPRRLR